MTIIVDRPVQIELLTQLKLPLLHDGGRCQDQDALRAARQPCLPKQHARLDRLAESYLVRKQDAFDEW